MNVALFDGVANLARDLIDRFVPDPQKKLEALQHAQDLQHELLLQGTFADRAELELAKGQLAVNQAEASAGGFASTWRPAFGWVGVLAFALQYLVGPLGEWISTLAGHPVKFPALDTQALLVPLAGILGLGAYRTTEKLKGVA